MVGTPNITVTPVLLDQVEGARGRERLLEDQRAALEERRQARHVEGRRVEHGCGQQGHLVGGEVGVDECVDAVPGEVGVAEHGALRAARGPRGVHDHCEVVEGDVLVEGGVRGLCQRLVVRVVDGDEPADSGGGRERTERRGVDEHGRTGVGEAVPQLGVGEPDVERDEDGAQPARREQVSRNADGSGRGRRRGRRGGHRGSGGGGRGVWCDRAAGRRCTGTLVDDGEAVGVLRARRAVQEPMPWLRMRELLCVPGCCENGRGWSLVRRAGRRRIGSVLGEVDPSFVRRISP